MVMFRIVLCDDSPADLMVLRGHLEQLKEKRPVDIISYTDGLDLLKDYKQKGFCDILVLDMRMKTMISRPFNHPEETNDIFKLFHLLQQHTQLQFKPAMIRL